MDVGAGLLPGFDFPRGGGEGWRSALAVREREVGRIEALMSEMRLAEKIGQLVMVTAGTPVTGPVAAGDPTSGVRDGRIGSLLNLWGTEATAAMQAIAVGESRLGIPLFFGFDVVHGHRTVFPIPLGEAAAFDPDLWEATARTAAEEAAADGIDLTFAPMIDVARDPRWGRMAEGPGEDPLVASRMAAAKVRGFQGTSLADPRSVAATAKHFVAYGAPAAGRDYATVDLSERTLREVYLPPFAAAVRAGAAAVMPAFNIAGVPMTAHVPLLRDWLRGELGFEGVLVSDYNAVGELRTHGVAADLAEAAALALTAGIDIDMMSPAYEQGLPEALDRGLVTLADIDAAVRRVLALKERLGLFDAPTRRQRGRGKGGGHRPQPTEGLEQDGCCQIAAKGARHRRAVGPSRTRPRGGPALHRAPEERRRHPAAAAHHRSYRRGGAARRGPGRHAGAVVGGGRPDHPGHRHRGAAGRAAGCRHRAGDDRSRRRR